jgi:toluene monooxygenase system protein E
MPKTYWHLLERRRIPTQYELQGSQLAYHPRLGSSVRTPTLSFHEQHACSWQVPDWEAFNDPQETTYSTYVATRRDREVHVDQLLAACDDGSYDAALDRRWLDVLDALLSPLRYPCHALQLTAAYVAQLAPAGKLTVMLAFQAADEMRRVSRFAYRTKQLMLAHPGFAEHARERWLSDPALQPLREVSERLLATYDFSEAFCALNLVLKPMFDEVFGVTLARVALAQRDDIFARMLHSLHEDHRWHAEVATGFARFVSAQGHAPALRAPLERWQPRVREALLSAAEPLTSLIPLDVICDAIDRAYARCLNLAGLDGGTPEGIAHGNS